MRSARKFIKTILFSFFILGCGQNKGQTIQKANLSPTPVIVVETDDNKQIKGWQPQLLKPGYTLNWQHKNGSAIWFQSLKTRDFEQALNEIASLNNFEKFQIVAFNGLDKDVMFDEKGEARTIIAKGLKEGKEYKLALLLFYGKLFEEERTMGVHAYAAPESDFISSGGWVVPATFWLGVDPIKDVGDLVKQGLKPSKEQALVFAKLSDLWIESMYHLYVNQMQMNVQALHNARISAIAAGDPNAIIVPGSNGYNEVEYQY